MNILRSIFFLFIISLMLFSCKGKNKDEYTVRFYYTKIDNGGNIGIVLRDEKLTATNDTLAVTEATKLFEKKKAAVQFRNEELKRFKLFNADEKQVTVSN